MPCRRSSAAFRADVVIPAHDAAGTVAEAVESARRQRLAAASVVVAADACGDETPQRAAAAGAHVVEVNARSVAVARNRGAAVGSAPWIAFLDADDLWHETWLSAAATAQASAPDAGVLYGSVEELDAAGRRVRRDDGGLPRGDVFRSLLAEGFITTSAVIVRRDLFERAGGFDERFPGAGVEDWDLWLRLAASEAFVPVRGHHVVYRRFANSAMRDAERFDTLREASLRVVSRALSLRPPDRALERAAMARVLRESGQRRLHHGHRRAGLRDVAEALRVSPRDPRLWALLGFGALPPRWGQAALEMRRDRMARASRRETATPTDGPARVVHVITGLGAGGAEAMLVKLVERLDPREFHSSVVSLLDGGVNAERLRALGVPVTSLGMTRGQAHPAAVVRLTHALREARPHVVQTWMYQADVVGGLAARAARGARVVWNVQNSTLPPRPKRSVRLAVTLAARLSSRVPDRIVVCSATGLEHHVALGYPRERTVLIENGVDVTRFRPDPLARERTRASLGVTDDAVLVGLPARFAPEKDHPTFLDAIALLRRRDARVTAVLCGEGTTSQALRELIAARQLDDAVLCVGRCDDMPALLNGLDIACLSSSHVEAFSNALGEAMATALPCAATDVGDSARLLGDRRLVAPPGAPDALSAVLARLVAMTPAERLALGARLRDRVSACFDVEGAVERYALLYRELLMEPR